MSIPTWRGEQLPLKLGEPHAFRANGLFWCCSECYHLSKGKMSLTWLPPDYTEGECHHCKRVYVFASPYGHNEPETHNVSI